MDKERKEQSEEDEDDLLKAHVHVRLHVPNVHVRRLLHDDDVPSRIRGILPVWTSHYSDVEYETPTPPTRTSGIACVKMVKYETIEEKLQRAKASGSTIKLSYKTIAFTGSAKAGKTSFLNLLYQKNFESVYHSTGVAESQQVICSQKLRLRPFVAGNSPKWISLSHQTMLRQLNRYLHVQLESGNEPFYPEQLVKKGDSAHEQSKCSVEDDILSAQYYFFSSETIAGDIWNIFNLLDTGGQPEYINLLPAVSRSISVTFIVLNMSGGEKSLDEPVLVAHSEDGMQSFEPYHLEITNLEFIKRLMASSNNSVIQIKQQEKNRLCQCCIGTHADQVDKKEIEKIEKRLSTLATELNCKSHLWSLNEKILFPVDNTTAGSKNEDPVAEQIRDHIQEVVESGNIHEVPITWFIFLLELQKVSSEQKVYYITYTSAVKICIQGQLCQSEDELQDALKCFHNMGMLHYYHDVPDMKQFIITDHQWFFEKLTILVKLSFKGQIINSEAITKFKKEGLLSKQLFFQIKIGTDIPTECFISLLEYLKIVAPVDTEHYFMPCVLPSYPSPSNDILTKYGKLQQIQLLVQFQQAPLPQGFFCCVAVEIFQSLPKNWLRPMQSTNDTHHTYNNLVTFHTSDTGHSVSLIDRIRYLEIQIRHKEASPAIHHDVKQFVSTTLVKVCNKLQLDSDNLQYGFLCGCGQTSEGRHMTMLPQKFDFVPQWIHCKYDKTKITDDHLVWLQPCQDDGSNTRPPEPNKIPTTVPAPLILQQEPDMWNLIKIVVPKVKASWDHVAYSMGYDVYFVKATKKDFSTLDERCEQVFTDWLTTSHGPTPKTWETLLSKLKNVDDLVAAVESIEKELTEHYK